MTQPPHSPSAMSAGWYPDPAAPPHAPARRYWDGVRWTEHTAPAAYGPPPGKVTRTPDGAPLAGWWHRVGAQLIDTVLVLGVVLVVGFPFVREFASAASDYVSASIEAAEAGTAPPSQADLNRAVLVPQIWLGLISLGIQLVYYGLMLRLRGATLGKLAVGLRVRQRDVPGQLPWPVIGKRLVGQFGYAPFALIPVIGGVISLYALLDVLWAAWDDKRQTLHDKIAGTNVVRTR